MPENVPPPIAPGPLADGQMQDTPEDVPEAKAISEHEVGEYREQDRYLPVRLRVTLNGRMIILISHILN